MLDDQEAMFDDKEAMFDDQEAMCVPMHFKVTATARFGCDNIEYVISDQRHSISSLLWLGFGVVQ